MLEEFRRADCSIQSVNIAGLRAAGTTEGLGTADGRDSLLNMAKSTGGEFYENFNDLSVAMGQMLRRTGVTYVLSFQPENVKLDGEFHRLRVEVKNQPRGTRVVSRPGWYSPQPFKNRPAMERLLETANDVMGEDGGEVQSSVIAAPFAGAAGVAEVPVVVEVDGPSLLAGKQDPQLPVEIYLYVMDPSGRVVDFVTQSVGLDVAKAEATLRQGGVKFFGHFRLPPGQYSLRTLVRNGATGGSGLRVSTVDVPAFAAGDPTLIPGVLQDGSPGRWVNLRQAKREGRPDPPYLFLLKGQPYVPTSRPAAAQGQELRIVLQGYHLGAGNWTAEAKLVDAAGKEVPGGAFQVVDREAATGAAPTRLVASFKPPALQPGDYALRVTLSDGAGKTETSTTAFAVAGPARPGRG
jgi:hypothetical protein